MNDRMSDMDALVELAAAELRTYVQHTPAYEYNSDEAARAALLAVGLPALLERVEAAEGEKRAMGENLRIALDRMLATEADRDALAAKVADAWDEGKNTGAADSAQIIGWAVGGANPDNEPESSPNPYRANLAETEKP